MQPIQLIHHTFPRRFFMRKTKPKNDSLWQIGTIPFVALWAATYAVAWLGIWAVFEWIESLRELSSQQTNLIGISFVSIVPAVLQVVVVERLLKKSMRGWIPASLLGTIMTALLFNDGDGNDARMLLMIFSLFVPLALAQMVWLWRRVESAWLWLLASVVAGIVFSLPMREADGSTLGIVMSGLLYGIVQGVIMRYLWMRPRETAKIKHEFAEDENSTQARLGRLQETDETAVSWAYADDAARQSKTQ
jgi:L-lactate permease